MIQQTRIKTLAIIFTVLAVVAWFVFQKESTKDTIAVNTETVGVEDTASVSKVTIYKKNGTEVLTRTPVGWVVNGKYKTRDIASGMLMVGLNQLEIKRPVSEESREKVMQLLKEKGARVVVENVEGKKELIFASNENDVNSTYLLIPGTNEPYIAFVPGIPGDINNLFRFSENDWRSRTLFATQPNHIQSLQVSYPQDPASNVDISYGRGNFEVKGVSQLDTARLYEYLPLYQNISISRFLDSSDSLSASLMKKAPFAEIKLVELDSSKSNAVEIYQSPDNQTEFYGRIVKTGEEVALKKDVFSRLLVKKNDFVKR